MEHHIYVLSVKKKKAVMICCNRNVEKRKIKIKIIIKIIEKHNMLDF